MNRQAQPIVCGLAVLLISSAALGFAQPTDAPAQDTQQSKQQDRHAQPDRPHSKRAVDIRINADVLRTRLTRSIKKTEQILARHKAALEKLDAGASAKEVLAELKLDGPERRMLIDQRNKLQRKPDGKPDGSPQHPPSRMTPQEKRKIHQFIGQNFPELSENLKQVIKKDPRGADRLLGQLAPQIREILAVKDSEPELARIMVHDMQAGMNFVEASRKFRMIFNNPNATESENVDALARLRDAAAVRFAAQLDAKQYEISKLEARLNELKDSVDRLESKQDEEIDRMVLSAQRNAMRLRRPNATQDQHEQTKKPDREDEN